MNFANVDQILDNIRRYTKNTPNIEYASFTDLHKLYGGESPHALFNKVYSGDMFVYDQENGDNWSGYFGSKPDLKYHIRKVFNKYRAVESLMFGIKAEFERVKTI